MKFTKIKYVQYKNLKMKISVSGIHVCMITFWITKILFRSAVLSISRTNDVSIKVIQIAQQNVYFQKVAVHYFLFSRKGTAIVFSILFHCCLPENNLSFRQVCELKQLVRWSRTHAIDTDLENDWEPNHFVLLIPERLIRVKPNETQPIQRKCDITNFFAKIT